jgi:hypothetical protein
LLNRYSVSFGFIILFAGMHCYAQLTEIPVGCGETLRSIGLDLQLAVVAETNPQISQVIAYYRTADGQAKKQALSGGRILTTKLTSRCNIVVARSNGIVDLYRFNGSEFNIVRRPVSWDGFQSLLLGSY